MDLFGRADFVALRVDDVVVAPLTDIGCLDHGLSA
jgi:hypothetical protein